MEALRIEAEIGSPPIKQLIELAGSYYDSGDLLSHEYLAWEYDKNPFGKPVYALAYDNKQLVGQYLVIPLEYIKGSEVIRGSLSLNTLTHPDYTGRGLFTRMASITYEKCVEDGIEFTLGFPNPLSFTGFVKKLDFVNIGYASMLLHPLRPASLLLAMFNKNSSKKHGGDLVIDCEVNGNDRKKGVSQFTIADAGLYSDFWDALRNSRIYQLNKNWEFIKWRYFDVPTRAYHGLKLVEGGKIQAIMFYRVEAVMGVSTGILMDIMCRDTSKSVAVLLGSLKKILRREGVQQIVSMDCGSSMQSVMRKHAFFRVPQKFMPQRIPVIFRAHRGEYTEASRIENWRLAFGDYDVF